MKKLIAASVMLATLSGCVVYPVAPGPVVVAPPRVYVGPPVYVGPAYGYYRYRY